MKTLAYISIIFLLAGAQPKKFLKVPEEGLASIKLVLKDQLSGSAIESYALPKEKHSAFLADLNKAKHSTELKMNITCYRFEIAYHKKDKIEIPTNGKGLGPTPLGYFLTEENLIFKYFPIDKSKWCKPTKSKSKSRGSFGF